MDRAQLDIGFFAQRVVHEDDHLLAADKPAGISTHSSERGDLVSRLTDFLERRDGLGPERVALAVHQQLERDASGLVVLARTREANRGLAQQLAGGGLASSFAVAMQAGPQLRDRGRVAGWLVRDGSSVRVAERPQPHALEVSLTYEVLARHGGRAIIQTCPVRCGARHVRALLSARGLGAIAGDRSASWAPRPLVHATTQQLKHPATGASLQLHAPVPWLFHAWLLDRMQLSAFEAAWLEPALCDALMRRWQLQGQLETDAVRLVHGEAEAIGGLDVERFGDHLVAWVAEEVAPEMRERLLDILHELGPAGVYLKIRPKQASRVIDARRAGMAPQQAARGLEAADEVVATEGPSLFAVRLNEGFSSGLFLDQRGNRAWVRERSSGCKVLNLFAYSCSFTVAAAQGGATSSTSVDVSSQALERGRRNLELNRIAPAAHELVCDDVLPWLKRAQQRPERFDLVVLDPPSFSTTRHSRFRVDDTYLQVAEACYRLLGPGVGWLLACTNHRGTSSKKLERWLQEAAQRAGRRIVSVRHVEPEPDFPSGEASHMKAVRVQVAEGRSESVARSKL